MQQHYLDCFNIYFLVHAFCVHMRLMAKMIKLYQAFIMTLNRYHTSLRLGNISPGQLYIFVYPANKPNNNLIASRFQLKTIVQSLFLSKECHRIINFTSSTASIELFHEWVMFTLTPVCPHLRSINVQYIFSIRVSLLVVVVSRSVRQAIQLI